MAGTARIVGRSAELAAVMDSLENALEGRASVVLLAGDAGIGKTRILEELARLAGTRSVPVVWGRATNAEGAPPFWPWRQVLRSWTAATGSDVARRHLAEVASDLSRIAPEVAEFSADPESSDLIAADVEHRFALFETTAGFFSAISADEGLVLILDDLHWADPASLRLLAHLVGSIREARLLIVGAYRPAELAEAMDRSELMAQVIGAPTTVHLELDGLSRSEVGEHLRAVMGDSPDDSLMDTVSRRTGGNPLFVQEVGRLLAAGSEGVPGAVRTALGRRLATLPTGTQRLLRSAAVIGSNIDPGMVASVTETDPGEILNQLDGAIAAGLVRRSRGDAGYVFAHDLVRECSLLELGESDRANVHLAAAEYLERAGGEQVLSAVAYHRMAALPLGDPELASSAAERAAELARRQLAYEESARLYGWSLDAATAAGVPPPRRTRLQLDLARAHHLGHNGAAAMEVCEQAAALAQETGDYEALAHAALIMEDTSEPDWVVRVDDWCDIALSRLPDTDSPLRARLLAQRAGGAFIFSDQERLESVTAEALDMADRTGDPTALASALRARQLARSTADGVHDRLRLADRMEALAEPSGDRRCTMWGHLWRFDGLLQLGDADAAEAELTRLQPVVEGLRQPLARWHLTRSQATIHMARGRFDDALEADERALAIATASGHGTSASISSAVRMWRATLTGNEIEGEMRHEDPADAPPVLAAIINLGFAEWHLAFGRLEEAQRHYAALPPLTWRAPPFLQLSQTAGRGAVAAALGDRAGAEAGYQALLPLAKYHVVGGAGAIVTRGSVEHFLGVTAAGAGDARAAARHLRAAIEANRAAGMPPQVAESSCHLAELLVSIRSEEQGKTHKEALGHATEAKAIADRLGMPFVAARAGAVLSTLDDISESPLSRREQEVARLVAEGLTNVQIAERLFISQRTAQNHVQHILNKLGYDSRTQIAVWVTSGGLGER